jgi:Flp pilus assembly secretin CpaC
MDLLRLCRIGSRAWSLVVLITAGVVSAGQPEVEIEHLIKAAAHLEQAGHRQMADDLRQLAAEYDESPKRRLLETKRAQMAELQAEIQLLERSLASPATTPKVIVQVKLLQLSMGKLRNVGLNLVSVRQLLDTDSPPTVVEEGGNIMQFLELLETQGFAAVVSRPTLATSSGRPASIRIDDRWAVGQNADPDDGSPNTQRPGASRGLRLECTPTVLSGGKVRVAAGFRVASARQAAESDSDKQTPVASPLQSVGPSSSSASTVATRRLDLMSESVEMAPGQTLILARPSEASADQATLALLQVEVVAPSGK